MTKELEPAAIADAVSGIQKVLPGFDYPRIVGELRDLGTLKPKFAATNVGYKKIQIFRMSCSLTRVSSTTYQSSSSMRVRAR
jgi:hypothetical protein